jgi:outer membrane protein OmpA-like peptidoglycan-associated protein
VGPAALSQRRAEAVRKALIKGGVNPSMLTAKGYGASRPAASNDTLQGRLQNRRTEFALAGVAAGTTAPTR